MVKLIPHISLLLLASLSGLQGRQQPSFSASQSLGYETDAELNSPSAGDVSRVDTTTRLAYTKQIDRTRAVFSAAYTYADWDFSGAEWLEQTHELSLGILATHRFESSKWGVIGIGSLSFAGEDEDMFGAGQSITAGGGVTYRFLEDLTFGLGGVVNESEERDIRFFPLIYLDWKINDEITLRTSRGATLFWNLNAKGETEFSLGLNYDSSSYRTRAQVLPDATNRKAILEDDAVTLEVGVTQRFFENLKAGAKLGAHVWREIELRADDSRVEDYEVDPSLRLELTLSASF